MLCEQRVAPDCYWDHNQHQPQSRELQGWVTSLLPQPFSTDSLQGNLIFLEADPMTSLLHRACEHRAAQQSLSQPPGTTHSTLKLYCRASPPLIFQPGTEHSRIQLSSLPACLLLRELRLPFAFKEMR